MNTVPIVVIIAMPVIAFFFLFVLLPRIRRADEERKRR